MLDAERGGGDPERGCLELIVETGGLGDSRDGRFLLLPAAAPGLHLGASGFDDQAKSVVHAFQRHNHCLVQLNRPPGRTKTRRPQSLPYCALPVPQPPAGARPSQPQRSHRHRRPRRHDHPERPLQPQRGNRGEHRTDNQRGHKQTINISKVHRILIITI